MMQLSQAELEALPFQIIYRKKNVASNHIYATQVMTYGLPEKNSITTFETMD